MKILIDIGNTNTSIAIVKNKKIAKRYFIRTSRAELCAKALKRLLGKAIEDIDAAITVSVVPGFLSVLKRALKIAIPKVEVKVVGKDVIVPIKNKYKKPDEVGQDRLVTAYAASRKLKTPVVAIDFGTAVTFDFVNKNGEYEGGLIFPGLRVALKALVHDAALLPKIDIKPSRSLVGRDTKASMNNGMLYGYASVCDGLIQEFRQKYGKSVNVIATGGDAALVAKYSKYIKHVSGDLIFEGLNLL